ncbi:DnaA regulatory inactivator Hda [Thalassotalea insulae]|uniref:DnaA regulatory inactivator Hda n=1 Tax=Thalassotalea insulae TaxID=2056778 RepID=A0ABQ6GW06_9GAMM|nr:DnaA regulatory inactivator Hda [Thalassotalea insulae]GLX80103.1 DnaA regulatory inactivator Hda [Thalassotalea insulae]
MSKIAQLTLSVQLPDDETFISYQSITNHTVTDLLKAFINGAPAQTRSGKEKQVTDDSVKGFYLFGLTGVGKSHLLHASCAYAQELGLSSVCLSFSELQQLSVAVLDGLETIDVICLDDVQLIADNAQWQQAVFDLFNRVFEHNKKIIITGDKSVNQLGLTLPDLGSRLSWGLVEQLKPLSDEEKLTAIQFRAQQRGLLLSEEVARFLLTRLSREMNSLLDALDKLDKASIREQRRITIPFIKQVLLES